MAITINIPDKVEKIITTLNNSGYEAFIVGGCVRDSILGKSPDDWDITTSALPDDIKELFKKTIDTGIEHGTVTVLIDREPFEITTYRIDGDYEDYRRPKEVFFTKNLIEDLKRRDFTINAMAYHTKEGLIDPFNGEGDLHKNIIRCVGIADDRFHEDALRMLRAVRFSAKLGFKIDKDTKDSIKKNAELITNVSGERIRDELNKLLISANPSRFIDLKDLNLLKHIMPEFIPCFFIPQNNPHHSYDVATHIIKTVEAIEPELSLRWTMLFHDMGKAYTRSTDADGIDHFYKHDEVSVQLADKILKRLKFDNKTIRKVLKLVEEHDYRFEPEQKAVRIAMNRVGKDLFEDFIKVQRADAAGQNPDKLEKRSETLDRIYEVYNQILKESQCTSIKELKINGNDLISIGIKQGIELGQILNKLLEIVLDKPEKNNRNTLLELAENLKKN